MSTFTIKDEDSLIVNLGGSYLDVVLDSSSLEAKIEFSGNYSQSSQTESIIARVLILEKIADEIISALSLVYLNTQSTVKLADNSTESTGTVTGIALNASAIGGVVRILVFGVHNDPFFNYGINERLFLGISGQITTTEPSFGVLTCVGFGLGVGAIQIGIDKPVLL